MRFCAVLRNYPKDVPGGAEYQSYLIGQELSERGHEVFYLAHQSDENSVNKDDGITVYRLNHSGTHRIIETLGQINADVYYFRLAPDLPLLWRSKRRLESNFVYNISRDVQCYPLYASGPYRDSNNILENMATRGRYALYRFLLRIPDEIFVQSHQQQQLLKKNHGIESTVIGNGHPIPDADIKKHSPPVVLWLATLKKVKKVHRFVELVRKNHDLSCQFWVVGQPVDGELREYIRKKETEYEKLEYLGGCGILESNGFFRKSSVYVHTGEAEGFPNTFIQSWLHETPVVSLCTDPDSELRDHDIGAHCQSLNEAATEVRKFISDQSYRERVGGKARDYAISRHSINSIGDKIEKRLKCIIRN